MLSVAGVTNTPSHGWGGVIRSTGIEAFEAPGDCFYGVGDLPFQRAEEAHALSEISHRFCSSRSFALRVQRCDRCRYQDFVPRVQVGKRER